jgi:hypothetical protein
MPWAHKASAVQRPVSQRALPVRTNSAHCVYLTTSSAQGDGATVKLHVRDGVFRKLREGPSFH